MGQLVRLPGPVVHVPAMAADHSRRLVYAVFVLVSAGLSIGIITAVAYWSNHPLVVPSLGPTAFLIFNRSQSVVARPRNAVLGHLVGAVAGYVSLLCFGLAHAPSVVSGGLSAPRIGAAALSIGLTSAVMILADVEHGPAGATTLIVSLGFMTTPASLGLLMAGVVSLVACGIVIDRAAGLHVTYWANGGDHRVAHPVLARLGPLSPDKPSSDHRNGSRSPSRWRKPGEAERRFLVPPGEGREVLVGAQRCRVKVDGARADGSYSVVELELDPSRPVTLLHYHHTFAETYIVTEGEVEAEIGADRFRAGPGAVIAVPPDVVHLVGCGRRPARCLCITEHVAQSTPEFLP
ncbi:MAG: HPP family protein [Acidimicrobiales bacterium]|nr:HPP family protein [Acidimicrobiales bacterium]